MVYFIISLREKDGCCSCIVKFIYVWVFLSAFFMHAASLTMSWVGLWSVIVAFPGPEVINFFHVQVPSL